MLKKNVLSFLIFVETLMFSGFLDEQKLVK